MEKGRILPGTSVSGTNIRILDTGRLSLLRPHGVKKIVSDTDGTISTLRAGWEKTMRPMMVEMIIGKTKIDGGLRDRIESEVIRYVDDSTGINTILQMEHLVDMVRQYGLVPTEQILDAQAYKAEYNRRLMVWVSERIGRLSRSEIKPVDVTVRGALQFVKAVSKLADVSIFSGTDHEDVVKELTAIGLFDHIESVHGALKEYKDSNKEKVLRELMAQCGLRGSEIVVIGDGKVEAKVGDEAGCVVIGVASDELLGRGWNWEKIKRLEAYADILIPDFRNWRVLMQLLKLS